MKTKIECVAFLGSKRIAEGELAEVAAKAHRTAKGKFESVLIFDNATGELIEEDPRKVEDPPRQPGRPKLGVVPREVTLLPRHWEWLNVQPGGASVALRKLVEDARRVNRNTDRLRAAKEAAYRFITALAGNESGFEEATRALFAGDAIRFAEHSRTWPPDVREHAAKLASRAFAEKAAI
jgi:hypothetical protein